MLSTEYAAIVYLSIYLSSQLFSLFFFMIARRHNELVKSAVSRPPRNQKCHKYFILVENYPAHEKLPPPREIYVDGGRLGRVAAATEGVTDVSFP